MSDIPFEVDRWEEVDSSLIKAIGTKGDFLVVQFKRGEVYRYPKLSSEFDSLLSAPSIGKYFHQNVRNQSCQKITMGWPDYEE